MVLRKVTRFASQASFLALLAVGAACGDPGGVETCGEIPEDGCPSGRGGSCDDLVCAGLYDCVGGEWTLEEDCGEVSDASTTTGAGGAGGAGACDLPELDRTGEVSRCTPDLQEPDCPVAAAEVCVPCMSGCVDFFLCTEDGWLDVAACAGTGELVIIPR